MSLGKEKNIIVALYRSGWTTKQIAQAVGKTRGSIASLISREGLSKADRGLILKDALKFEGLDICEFFDA